MVHLLKQTRLRPLTNKRRQEGIRNTFTTEMTSVTRLGDLLIISETKKSAKVAQMIGNFLGYFEKPHSYVSIAASYFWGKLGSFLL